MREKAQLHAWYCKEAVAKYKQASTIWPKNRVNEVIDRLAYGAMKNDVSHYLRSLELDRLLHSPTTREEELLNLLLSKTVIGLWILGVVLIMVGIYFTSWLLPNHKAGSPN